MPQNRFCTNCGTPIATGNRFCENCGMRFADEQPVSPLPIQPQIQNSNQPQVQSPPPVVQPPAAAAAEEPVIAVLPSLGISRGLFKIQSYNLVVTPQRLVFALITSEMLKKAAEQAKTESQDQGKGFIKQWGAVITSTKRITDAYFTMPITHILAENPDNFAIQNGDVESIRLKVDMDMESGQKDSMIIRYSGGKLSLTLNGCSAGDAKKVLKPIFGNRVK